MVRMFYKKLLIFQSLVIEIEIYYLNLNSCKRIQNFYIISILTVT